MQHKYFKFEYELMWVTTPCMVADYALKLTEFHPGYPGPGCDGRDSIVAPPNYA